MLTEDEIMGGIGFGDDNSFDYPPLSLSKYGKNIPDEIELDNGDTIKKYMKSRSINLPLEVMPNSTFIPEKERYYTSMMSPVARAGTAARAGIVTSPLDPSGALSKKSSVERFKEGLDNVVQGTLGDNTISILLTIIFVLIVAMVVLQIIHARKIHKLVKTFMKSISELHSKKV
jgi:hypothetical protein